MRSATSEPVGRALQVAGPRLPAVEDVVHQPGAARLGQELGAEADQPARRHQVLQPHPAGRVVDHLLHPALAHRQRLGDDADVVLGHVDRQSLDRLVWSCRRSRGSRTRGWPAVSSKPSRRIVSSSTTSCSSPRPSTSQVSGRSVSRDPDRDVADQLLVEAVADLARGQPRAVPAGQGRGVDPDRDRERGLVDRDHRQRPRVLGIGERLADRHLLEAGDGDDLAGPGLGGLDPVQRLGHVEVADGRRARPRRWRGTRRSASPAADRAVVDAADRQPPYIRGGVEVRHVRLQRRLGVVGRAPGSPR